MYSFAAIKMKTSGINGDGFLYATLQVHFNAML